MPNDTQTLATTETTIELIEVIQDLGEPQATEIAAELDLAKSTVYKHLSTLLTHGLVVRTGERYRLGARFFDIGMSIKNHNEVYKLAGKHVHNLASRSNEEADFSIMENGRLITIFDAISSTNGPSFRSEYYQYLHTTAIGKAILAKHSDEKIEAVINQWGLPAVTDNTISSKDELYDEIYEVRKMGYAINDQESRSGKRVVGMAVEYPESNIVGGFCICGPKYRITNDDLHGRLLNILQDEVHEFKKGLEDLALMNH